VEAARASAERWALQKPLSVFDGVPFAAKDNQDTLGYDTHSGTKIMPLQCAASTQRSAATLVVCILENGFECGWSLQGGERVLVPVESVLFSGKGNNQSGFCHDACLCTRKHAQGTQCRRSTPGDCSAVATLRSLGAILIGKTVMHELGFSPVGVNPHHGISRNPWNPGHVCGGSSSGAPL
jgi:Asp-tRNA(Asn)/Glu-tRNA(Gln) amidotransferase A subunit family amidase